MDQAKLIISGQVQGVFFRSNAQDLAEKLNLVGYAKNLSDGNVEILIQGSKENINTFIEWSKEGPPSATVNNVAVTWSESDDQIKDFTIKY